MKREWQLVFQILNSQPQLPTSMELETHGDMDYHLTLGLNSYSEVIQPMTENPEK